jgi:hypothetical protein
MKGIIGIVILATILQVVVAVVAWILESNFRGLLIWQVVLFFAGFNIVLLLVHYKLIKDEVRIVGGEK